MEIKEIEIKLIDPNPHQTRKKIDEKSLKTLIKSIRENGLINPINVTKQFDRYIILSGHRRFSSYKKMRKKVIPCIIKKGKESDLKINMAHENFIRDDLQPIEKANTIKLLISDKIPTTRDDATRMCQLIGKLKNYKNRGYNKYFDRIKGFKENDIFVMDGVLKSINISENNAVTYLTILSLPKSIQDAVSWKKGQIYEEGKIKLTLAEQIARVKNKEFQKHLFNKCITQRVTKERLRALVNNHIKEVESGNFKGIYRSADVQKLKSELEHVRTLENNLISTSKNINTFKITSLQRLKYTLEKQEFLSSVGRIKNELLVLLHQINEKLEGFGVHDTEKESTTFNIEVLNQPRKRKSGIVKGGKRFSFPKAISNELNLGEKSRLTIKVIKVEKILNKPGGKNGRIK